MMSLDDVYKTFPSDESCLRYIFETIYPSPLICPKCKRIDSMHYNKANKNFVCTCGQYSIFPKTGTLFHQSGIGLTRYFLAMYLFAHEKDGITSKELAEKTGISEPSAHYLRKRIAAMIERHLRKEKIAPSAAEKERLLKAIKNRFPKLRVALEDQYVAEFYFREHYRKQDGFLVLLNLAMQKQPASVIAAGRSPIQKKNVKGK